MLTRSLWELTPKRTKHLTVDDLFEMEYGEAEALGGMIFMLWKDFQLKSYGFQGRQAYEWFCTEEEFRGFHIPRQTWLRQLPKPRDQNHDAYGWEQGAWFS